MVAIPMATAIHRFHPPILSDVLCIRLRGGGVVAVGAEYTYGFVAACWDDVKLEVGEVEASGGVVAEVGVKNCV
jgi:hypothetical protein